LVVIDEFLTVLFP